MGGCRTIWTGVKFVQRVELEKLYWLTKEDTNFVEPNTEVEVKVASMESDGTYWVKPLRVKYLNNGKIWSF